MGYPSPMSLSFCMQLCFATLAILSFIHFVFVYEATIKNNPLLDNEDQNTLQYAFAHSAISNGEFHQASVEDSTVPILPPKPVKILFWVAPNNPPSKPRLWRMNKMVETMNGAAEGEIVCPTADEQEKYPCEFSIGSENVSDADAVVFFMFTTGYKRVDLPMERRQQQLWIMYAREPPPFSNWPDSLENLFNWTQSFREDSDVWTPYGKKLAVSTDQVDIDDAMLFGNLTLEEWVSGKSKFAAAVISNCHTNSHRETLISEMNKTKHIDVYGACGERNICPPNPINCTDFWAEMASQYKFYLSFENALCKDYITEKFWRTLAVGMVPVVYGGGNYSMEAPPHSFINVRDYDSVENLMKHLEMLDGDEKEYSKYFQWRNNFSIQEYGWLTHDWCALCKAVHEHKQLYNSTVGSSYSNLKWWWHHRPNSNESACEDPPF